MDKYLIGLKKVTGRELQIMGAIDDINLGTLREIGIKLKGLGWERVRTSKVIFYLAPGENKKSAGIVSLGNPAYTVRQLIRGLKVDEFYPDDLVRKAEELTDAEDVFVIVQKILSKLPDWYLDKANKFDGKSKPIWRRKTAAEDNI